MRAVPHAAILRTVGVMVFLLGLASAGLVYRAATNAQQSADSSLPADGSDSTLAPLDSKKSTHDIELYGGKVELLMVQWLTWWQRPESVAILLVSATSLVALGCFLVARRLDASLTES